MDVRLFHINCDIHVVETSNMVDASRFMYLYCETIEETQTDEYTLSQIQYHNDPESKEYKRKHILKAYLKTCVT